MMKAEVQGPTLLERLQAWEKRKKKRQAEMARRNRRCYIAWNRSWNALPKWAKSWSYVAIFLSLIAVGHWCGVKSPFECFFHYDPAANVQKMKEYHARQEAAKFAEELLPSWYKK